MNKAAIELLKHKFQEAKLVNPQYSMRAFAIKCGISSGALSEILSGKRSMTPKQCLKIVNNLQLNPLERNSFLSLVGENELRIRKVSFLSSKNFNYISEGIYFDFLALMDTIDFKFQLSWIAYKLGISEEKSAQIIKRLTDIQLIEERNGQLIKLKEFVNTSDDVKDQAIQLGHAETLKLAKESLFNDPVNERDFTSVCIPLDPELLIQIKEKIRNFHMEIRELALKGQKTEVYELAIQFFPKTKHRNKTKLPRTGSKI